LRIDESVFIVLEEHLKQIEEFLKEWEDKVIWHEFEVLLDEARFKELMKEVEEVV